jgi:hypothetical protein
MPKRSGIKAKGRYIRDRTWERTRTHVVTRIAPEVKLATAEKHIKKK